MKKTADNTADAKEEKDLLCNIVFVMKSSTLKFEVAEGPCLLHEKRLNKLVESLGEIMKVSNQIEITMESRKEIDSA